MNHKLVYHRNSVEPEYPYPAYEPATVATFHLITESLRLQCRLQGNSSALSVER